MVISTKLVGKGIALGLGAAVPIGPVNVEIARRSLRGGFWAGFALGCGAVSVDVFYAVMSSLSLGQLLTRPLVKWPITLGGIAFLLYLSYLCWRGAAQAWRTDPLADLPPVGSRRTAYLTGLLMTLLNPMTIGFWFLVVPGSVGAITKEPATDLPMICTGVFIGTIGWVVTFAGTLGWAGRWRKNWWLAAADALGALVLFAFAAAEVWQALRLVL